jgi:hypothetical protein
MPRGQTARGGEHSMAVDYVWPDRKNRQRPKATYELNVYVVPVDPRGLDPDAVPNVMRWLKDEGIVGQVYDEGLGWFAPGARSDLLFTDVRPGEYAFEYVIPYVGPAFQFVPNAHTGRFGATCPVCRGDLDELLHAFVRQSTGDASTHALQCACGELTPVDRLGCAIETAVTPAYLNFCHVNSGELRDDVRAAIEGMLGQPTRILRERL